MLNLSRQQIIAWSALGLVILLIGAHYLRGQLSDGPKEAASMVTVGVKEEKEARPTLIKVHIAGAVAQPGLYELEGGSRIADALQRAGGHLPSADLNQINLAAKLVDGQQVAVPEKGALAPAGAAGAPSGAANRGPSPPLNLNTATADQLEELDGVGPKTAQKIIDYREAHGGFKSIEDLMEVPGIGSAKFDQLKDQVSV